ncbi:cellulose biosynthesis protein BcsE [Chromobacterium alticapitis]|uniref:Cellulose biosynthesis protein BcsE n=1 Tax=Chromobacterium alticapitis TaxID=2073169 RepID=A0A2S5DBS3_9NEIS|nr:cellulose biosynthesis protein BcsE [Chromobacterium alticapitis]POZ60536.1 cellulose biosynthesis protein BcsE [Chromobacterium alticapitis]
MDSYTSLGIHELPLAATSLMRGGVYLVASGSEALTQSLLFANLPASAALPTICSARLAPGPRQDTAWLDRRLLTGNLVLLSPRKRWWSRPMLTDCLEDLSHGRDRQPDAGGPLLLVLAHAEDFLRLHRPNELKRELKAAMSWARARDHCVLLILNLGYMDLAAIAQLEQAAHRCAGLALAQAVGVETFSWQISHWLGAETVSLAQAQVLTRDEDGALCLLKEEDELAARPAHDTLQVYATRTSLTGNEPPSPLWQLYEDLEELLVAAKGAVAASVLLDTASQQRNTLTEAIAQLRKQCGRRLKIVVREVGGRRLRQNEEQLLLRLGANTVLPAELHFASTVNLINALQPAVFQPYVKMEQQQLQDASQPAQDRGWLAPAEFIETVRKTVQRSSAISIRNMLVLLQPAIGVTPRELLAQGRFQRAGDLCTADRRYAYLFLFACAETDVPTALANLFRLPVEDIVESEIHCPDSESILQALTRLEAEPELAELEILPASGGAMPAQAREPQRVPLQRMALRRRGA